MSIADVNLTPKPIFSIYYGEYWLDAELARTGLSKQSQPRSPVPHGQFSVQVFWAKNRYLSVGWEAGGGTDAIPSGLGMF